MKTKRSIRNRSFGFSLVEVAMAIGIFSFCLLSVMGLIPVALQASRSSMNKNIEVRILQAVRANLRNTPYSAMPSDGFFLFDADGGQLTNENDADLRYRVVYKNYDVTSLPESQSAGKLTTSMLTISDVVTAQVQTSSLHLSDNGF